MTLITYAMLFIGTPYIYASNGGGAFDCSGFICELLKHKGVIKKDKSAQSIFDFLKNKSGQIIEIKNIKGSDFIFYGKDQFSISHIAMAVNEVELIESGGGDSSTTTFEEARKRGAMVRLRPVNHRSDIVAVLRIL
jgi:cell wall-associated NlpC family hydrolase